MQLRVQPSARVRREGPDTLAKPVRELQCTEVTIPSNYSLGLLQDGDVRGSPQTAGYLRVHFCPASANRFPLRTYDSYDIPDMETTSTSREAARRSTRTGRKSQFGLP